MNPSTDNKPLIGVSCGDINGIGIELIIAKLIRQIHQDQQTTAHPDRQPRNLNQAGAKMPHQISISSL